MKINDFAKDHGDHCDGTVTIDPEDDGNNVTMGAADVWSLYESYRNDIITISEALASEAVQRDWCGEFEDFVHSVNKRLSWKLETHQDVKAQFVVSFTFDTVIPFQRATATLESELVDIWAQYIDNIDNQGVNLHGEGMRMAARLKATFVHLGIEGTMLT